MNWSPQEKKVAKKIFELARDRDYRRLIDEINSQKIESSEDIWQLRELLNEKAKQFDRRYDYRYSVLLEVFMYLVADNLISINELEGLSTEKIEWIKRVIERVLSKDKVYQLKITLDGIKPLIYRTIEIKDNGTFYDLHLAIQIAFSWMNAHLYEFQVNGRIIGDLEMDDFGDLDIRDELEVYVKDEIYNAKEINYVYDFGDHWAHTIKLVAVSEVDEKRVYPRCIAGKRSRPPEDVGSLPGFENFKAVMNDKNHEEYDEMFTWYGGPFDPDFISLKEINDNYKAFVKGDLDIESEW